MLDVGMTYRDVDLILYTHIHPDHIADLVPILFACKYPGSPRKRELLVMGGPGFEGYFGKLKKIHGSWIEPQTYNLSLKEVSESTLPFRDLKISAKSMAH